MIPALHHELDHICCKYNWETARRGMPAKSAVARCEPHTMVESYNCMNYGGGIQ